MKEYEMIRQIFNECPNNKTRDNFIEEICTDDLDVFVEQMFPDKMLRVEKMVCADGSIVYDVESAGLHQRLTFTEF